MSQEYGGFNGPMLLSRTLKLIRVCGKRTIEQEECVCLMKNEKQYFDKAISLKSYKNQMEQYKEGSFQIYDQFECPKDDEFIEIPKKTP